MTILSIAAVPVLFIVWLFFILGTASSAGQSLFSLIVQTVAFSALFPHYEWFTSGPVYEFFAVHGGGEIVFLLPYLIYGLVLDWGRNTGRTRIALRIILIVHGVAFLFALVSSWNGYQELQELERLYG